MKSLASICFGLTSIWSQQVSADLQTLGVLQAQLAELTAQQNEARHATDLLLKQYKDSHPSVLQLKRNAERYTAQAEALSQTLRRLDTVKSFSTGGTLPLHLAKRWWKDSDTARVLGLTPVQRQRMDEVFQQSRLKLIDLNAALERAEVTLEPLMAADPLNETLIVTQIDRVAKARSDLESATGRMLLGIRKVLSIEQWTKLGQILAN